MAAYGTANVMAANPAKADTITDAAVRLEDKSRVLRERVSMIASRVLEPVQAEKGELATPPPSHAAFALRSAENSLAEALDICDQILRAL